MLLISILVAATATCPTERAQYRLSSDPTVTAEFHAVPRSPQNWQSGVALQVRFGKTDRSYWFLPWNGGTNGRTNVAWVREKRTPIATQPVRDDLPAIFTDAAFSILDSVPGAGDPAPAHILLLDLRTLTWYRTPQDRRDDARRGFFDLVGCQPAPDHRDRPEIEFPPVP